MAAIKVEIEVDLGSDVLMGGTHSEQDFRLLKREIKEEDSPESPAASCNVGVVKCEYQSDPEYDDELKKISLEQHRVKTEPTERDARESGAAKRAEPKKRKQAAETASVQQTHQTQEDATTAPADTRHQCTLCRKCFSGSVALKTHLRQHIGEKYTCNLCKRQFKKSYLLKRHLMTHTDEKPFECHICRHRWSKKCDLKRHLITHTGEKPYNCLICHKKFAYKWYLEAHCKIHTADKPFKCNVNIENSKKPQ